MRQDAQQRVSKKFVVSLNLMYPYEKSVKRKTEKLNELLEKILYGKK